MAKNCAFCGKPFGKFSSPIEIPNTKYTYCDSHASYRVRLFNELSADTNADLSGVISNFKDSLKSPPETFQAASDAMVAYLRNKLAEDERQREQKANAQKEAAEARRLELIEQARKKEEAEKQHEYYSNIAKNLMLTTGFNFDGYRITKYHDVLFDELIIGKGFLKIITAAIDDLGAALTGSEASITGNRLNEVKSALRERVMIKAAAIGANALIGIDFESSFAGDLIMVSMTATAVTIEPLSE